MDCSRVRQSERLRKLSEMQEEMDQSCSQTGVLSYLVLIPEIKSFSGDILPEEMSSFLGRSSEL
jgi:hypothetical protein